MEFKSRMYFFPRFKRFSRIEGAGQVLSRMKLFMSHNLVWRFLGRVKRRALLEFLVMICVLSGLGIIAASQWRVTIIGSRGNVRVEGVGVYEDRNCSNATSYLDWGTLEPGSAQNITLYVRNEGNRVATLFLAVDNWNPANASNYMSLSWNYDGRMLSPMQTVEVTLTLSVSQNVENIVEFSFDVIIGTNA